MKLIKTRDMFIIDVRVPFSIDEELQYDEIYTFLPEHYLINSSVKHLKNLKEIFKSKSEILEMNF